MSATQLTVGIERVDRTAAALADTLAEVAESLEEMRADEEIRAQVDAAFRSVCRTRVRAARFSRQLVAARDRLRATAPDTAGADAPGAAIDLAALEARVAEEQAALARICENAPPVRRSEAYLAFRQRVWDVRNADRAMPPPSDGSDASADEDVGPEEDVSVAAQSTPGLTCPLTRVRMEEPVRNTRCGHVYCRRGLQTLRNGGVGERCPVAGCRQVLAAADLVRAADLIARLERASRPLLFD